MDVFKKTAIDIWFRPTLCLDSNAVEIASQYLSIDERVRRDQLFFDADRRDFTIAHDLLRRTLSTYTGKSPGDLRFLADEHSKPRLSEANAQSQSLSFSLSHTRGCVVCAVTTNASIGIDVEQIQRSDIQEVADRYFSSEEATWLRNCSNGLRSVRFTEVWTLKEAFLKAIGVGLSGLPANDIAFLLDETGCIKFSARQHLDPDEWHFALFEPIRNIRVGAVVQTTVRPNFLMRQYDSDGLVLAPIRVS